MDSTMAPLSIHSDATKAEKDAIHLLLAYWYQGTISLKEAHQGLTALNFAVYADDLAFYQEARLDILLDTLKSQTFQNGRSLKQTFEEQVVQCLADSSISDVKRRPERTNPETYTLGDYMELAEKLLMSKNPDDYLSHSGWSMTAT